MKLLVCTDGSSNSIQSANFVLLLRFPVNTQITILGVSESKNDMDNLSASMDMIDKTLRPTYDVDKKIRNGNPIEEIMSEALEASFDLVVLGGGGGQLGLLHPQLGSTTSKLSRKLHTHFLVARNVPQKISKALFCIGAEVPVSLTLTLGGEWISYTEAQIGLLHVLPQKKGDKQLIEPTSEKITHANKEQQDTLLSQARQQLQSAGVENKIVSKIRQGLVVDEVINEILEGGYDLLVVGAHYQPGQDRWQGTLLDDVTDQLLNRCTCSVLII